MSLEKILTRFIKQNTDGMREDKEAFCRVCKQSDQSDFEKIQHKPDCLVLEAENRLKHPPESGPTLVLNHPEPDLEKLNTGTLDRLPDGSLGLLQVAGGLYAKPIESLDPEKQLPNSEFKIKP